MSRVSDRSALVRLSPARADQARRWLSPPWVPSMLAPAIGRACRARPLAVPVRVIVPHAALGHRFARALHVATGSHGDLLAPVDDRPELRALPLGATVVLDPTRLDDEGRLALEALLDDAEVWVIAVTDDAAALPASLGERLAAVVVDVPPLARRQLEMPALSAAVLQTLAERAGRPVPALSPPARTRLAAHAWPGDLFELEAVLGRALAATEGDVVDLVHLGLEGDPAASGVAIEGAPEPASPPALPPTPTADGRLEALLAEVAHEILNPLSTVKMLLGHLPQLLEDGEARAALEGRADEAIERVDGLLQNLLEYARLGTPAREPVALGPLLDRLLLEAGPELTERAIRVRRSGAADVTCIGDPIQLEYGFRNLLAGVVREMPPREEFVVESSQNGVVAVRFAGGDVPAARLRAMVAADAAPDLGDPTMLPLAFTLARSVIERNGGTLAVREEAEGPTTLVVQLPTDDGMG
jgi:signal transduction histidine kinase